MTSAVEPKKFKLARHQLYASEMMEASWQLGVFYEAGTGKTMCVLDFLYRMFKAGEIENALVICPASITSSWAASIDKMAKFEGYTKYGIARMKEVVTIRSFQRVYEKRKRMIRHRDGTTETKVETVLRDDVNHAWGVIVIDESQGLGSHRSVQTDMCLKLAERSDRRYILSGTPVSGGGGGEDFKKLYGQLKFLNPDIWKNWGDFCNELVTRFDNFGNPCDYRKEECRSLMRNMGIVARLDDCVDMPESIDVVVPVECTGKSSEIYDRIRRKDTDGLGFTIRSGGTYYVKLLELVSGFILDDDKNPARYPTDKSSALEEIIEGTDDRVVVFCNYRESIEICREICEKHGTTVVFDGRSTRETWRDFQEGRARYLVTQYQSGGTGIDLFISHTTVFYEPSMSSLLMEQAKARTHRTGQTKRCLYYWLSTTNTVEEKVVTSVRTGVDVTRAMLEEWAKARKV